MKKMGMATNTEIDLKAEKLDPAVVGLIPETIARKHAVIAVKKEGKILQVAMADPLDINAIDELKLVTQLRIRGLKAIGKEITYAINHCYKIREAAPEGTGSLEEELRRTEEFPVVWLVNNIIENALKARASDIHLEPQEPEMLVRYRIDSILHDTMTVPRNIEAAVVSRVKILSRLDISERRKPQDGYMMYRKNGKQYDFRVSTMSTVNGEKMVIRIFDRSTMLISLENLGLSKADEATLRNLIRRPNGMILVTGPTGCGKTTTLYALLRQLNAVNRNIVTLENPVEYKLERISQVQVDFGAHMTFATGLRTIVRQDPDVIMVGEIRDRETAEMAVQAALTGHLVFSTLHTNDATSAITRLIDMGVEPFLIASTVISCVAQRLCRMICKACAGQGCEACYHTGYKGRTGIFEVMALTDNICRAVLNKCAAADIKKIALAEGMKTLEDDGRHKIKEGITTREELLRIVEFTA